ncbi:hypothetical protein QJQ45_002707 [Haematococcus lacustris]|nr:hypothetical protein QJQ45_002707 [Haematococcus lacustris]
MKAAVGRAQAKVQRLRDVEQSLMGTVDGLQGDLNDLQAAHQRLQDEHAALQQVASRAAATIHSLRTAQRSLQGQVHIYRHKRRPHHSPLTCKQRQQLLVLEQHPLRKAGYLRLDSHGRPMDSMAEQLSPAGLAPSPTDIFIPTQEGPVGRPAARTAPYNAHHCLSTVRLHRETGVSRRALSKCRQFFVSEQCVLPNPHRPGKTSTLGREFHIVSTYMRRNTLAIESIASLLAQYRVPLDMGAWGAKPQVPCDIRWASYISLLVSMLRVWAHAGDAVLQLLERQEGRSPSWAVSLSQLLQDNSLVLRISVVAVAGESFLVPELMWASKDDGLHAFELYRHTQDVLARLGTWDTLPLLAGLHSQLQHLAQMALPHLFAALGSSDPAIRMEVAVDVVHHAELRLPPRKVAWPRLVPSDS